MCSPRKKGFHPIVEIFLQSEYPRSVAILRSPIIVYSTWPSEAGPGGQHGAAVVVLIADTPPPPEFVQKWNQNLFH